jgi:hypothetical protein
MAAYSKIIGLLEPAVEVKHNGTGEWFKRLASGLATGYKFIRPALSSTSAKQYMPMIDLAAAQTSNLLRKQGTKMQKKASKKKAKAKKTETRLVSNKNKK